MSIYHQKRNGKPTGLLVVDVEVNGRRRKWYTSDFKLAKDVETRLKLGLEPPKADTAASSSEGYTLGQLAVDASAAYNGCIAEARHKLLLDRIMGLLGKSKTLASLTRTDLDALVASLKKKPGRKGSKLRGATINRYLACISGALKWAQEHPELNTGVPIGLVLPWQTEGKVIRPVLSREDQRQLLAWLTSQQLQDEATCMEFLLTTGCRVGELLALERHDMDLKGDQETAWFTFRDTKNGEDREVPVPMPLGLAVARLVNTGRLPSYGMIKKALYEARQALRLDRSLTVHCLRHTVATRASDSEIPDIVAMRLLGHKSHSTFRRYSQKTRKGLKEASRKIVGDLVGENPSLL